MSEIVYIAATGVVGSLSGILGTLFIGRRMFSDEKIMDKVSMVLEEVVNNAEMQKQVYSLGVLLGSGIAQGTGIKAGGKFKLQDLIMQGAGMFLQKFMGGNAPAGEQPAQWQAPQQEQAITKKQGF